MTDEAEKKQPVVERALPDASWPFKDQLVYQALEDAGEEGAALKPKLVELADARAAGTISDIDPDETKRLEFGNDYTILSLAGIVKPMAEINADVAAQVNNPKNDDKVM